MTLDLTKPLMIEGIGPVRLLTSEGRYPAHPIVVELEAGFVWLYRLDGESESNAHRLINAPEPPLVWWAAVYPDGDYETLIAERVAFGYKTGNTGSRPFRIEIPAEGKPSIEEVK